MFAQRGDDAPFAIMTKYKKTKMNGNWKTKYKNTKRQQYNDCAERRLGFFCNHMILRGTKLQFFS